MNTSITGRIVSRRTALAGLGAGSLGLALAPTARRALAQDDTPMVGHPNVGTWIADRDANATTEAPTLIINTADGATFDPIFGAAGVWQPTGPRSTVFTLAVILNGGLGGYLAIRGSTEIDETGMISTGVSSGTIVAPDGTVRTTFEGPSRATRLAIHPMEDGGKPLAEIPVWTPAPPADATPTA